MPHFAIHKALLSNGMTVLGIPQTHIPKVSLQLWYGVGSKNEASGEKGIAHLIEHMIFKGTKTLSESDINLITHKLSGYCNAFTSHDYTGYLFDLPSYHWHHALDLMADCMTNCTFKEDLLNAELKAVIQELKMYNDDYSSLLLEKLLGSIFTDHPYHYPVIGYKKDLWNLQRSALVNFYKKHYVPNNAALIAVGAVEPEKLFDYAEKSFAHIPSSPDYKQTEFYHSPDNLSHSVTIYRDVQQPLVALAWVVPGMVSRCDYALDVTADLIGSGKSSRLVRRLVDELQLATALESFIYSLTNHSLFIISFQPKRAEDIASIIDIILKELEVLKNTGYTEEELERSRKKADLDLISVVEDPQRLAYLVGRHFVATGDEQYLLNYNITQPAALRETVDNLIATCLRPSVMHMGTILPLPEQEKKHWIKLQEQSDQEDARVLARITRQTPLEAGSHVHRINVETQPTFNFPKPESFVLPNGLKVFYYHTTLVPKINLVLDFKARSYYDPADKEGLQNFLMELLQEGTEHHPDYRLSEELESHGISFTTAPGQLGMSMLSDDAHKGMSLLAEMLTEASFKSHAIERTRQQLLSDITDFWDAPTQFVGQLARQAAYGNHPYHKSPLGSHKTIGSITRDDLINAYKTYITPQEARLVLVGDLSNLDARALVEQTLGAWQGPRIDDLAFPALASLTPSAITHFINRDQAVLAYAGLSIRRLDEDYDKVLLFDQVLTGGVLGSMSSRLFRIREQSGLFYTIGGSLLSGAHYEPGIAFIKTIVSHEKLQEADQLITNVLNRCATDLTEEELHESQRAVTTAFVDNFSSNHQIALSFLFLDKFNLPFTYFDSRAKNLMNITKREVQEAAARLMQVDSMIKIRIGRLT